MISELNSDPGGSFILLAMAGAAGVDDAVFLHTPASHYVTDAGILSFVRGFTCPGVFSAIYRVRVRVSRVSRVSRVGRVSRV